MNSSDFPPKTWPLIGGQPIRGLVFGGKWLEFISQSQIKGDYNFNTSYFIKVKFLFKSVCATEWIFVFCWWFPFFGEKETNFCRRKLYEKLFCRIEQRRWESTTVERERQEEGPKKPFKYGDLKTLNASPSFVLATKVKKWVRKMLSLIGYH